MDEDLLSIARPFALVLVLGAVFWLAIRERRGRRLRRRDMDPRTNGHSGRDPEV